MVPILDLIHQDLLQLDERVAESEFSVNYTLSKRAAAEQYITFAIVSQNENVQNSYHKDCTVTLLFSEKMGYISDLDSWQK